MPKQVSCCSRDPCVLPAWQPSVKEKCISLKQLMLKGSPFKKHTLSIFLILEDTPAAFLSNLSPTKQSRGLVTQT